MKLPSIELSIIDFLLFRAYIKAKYQKRYTSNLYPAREDIWICFDICPARLLDLNHGLCGLCEKQRITKTNTFL